MAAHTSIPENSEYNTCGRTVHVFTFPRFYMSVNERWSSEHRVTLPFKIIQAAATVAVCGYAYTPLMVCNIPCHSRIYVQETESIVNMSYTLSTLLHVFPKAVQYSLLVPVHYACISRYLEKSTNLCSIQRRRFVNITSRIYKTLQN